MHFRCISAISALIFSAPRFPASVGVALGMFFCYHSHIYFVTNTCKDMQAIYIQSTHSASPFVDVVLPFVVWQMKHKVYPIGNFHIFNCLLDRKSVV